MRNYLLPIFALLIVGCGNQRPRQTYDEMLNDIVQNFNTGTTGGDSVLNAFVRKTQADSVARQYSNPAIKEEMMFNLISDYLVAGQVDNAQHLYDNMLEYAESEYGKVCQMKATVYFEKAHLYEQTGDLDNAIKMMQKSAEVFEKLPKNDPNIKYPYAFILNGCVGLIRTWLSSPQSESPEQVARLTYHLIENTIQGYLNMKK